MIAFPLPFQIVDNPPLSLTIVASWIQTTTFYMKDVRLNQYITRGLTKLWVYHVIFQTFINVFLWYIGILFCLLWHMWLSKMSNYINQRLQIGESKAWKMYIDDQFSFQWSLDEIHKSKLLATQLSSQNYHTDRAPLETICFTANIYSQFTVISS